MKTKKTKSRKKHPLLWIALIVAVLLAGAFGLYTQLGLNRPAPVVMPAVARGKIPPMPSSPVPMSTEQPSSRSDNARSETVPQAAEAGQGSAATAAAAGSSSNVPPSEPVLAATEIQRQITGPVTPEKAPSPPAVSGQAVMQESKPSSSTDSQAPAINPSSSESPTAAPDDRPAADSAAHRSSPAQQTEPQPVRSEMPNTAQPQEDPEPPAPFSVQVGAYLTKTNAERMVSQLMDKGYDAYIFQRTDKKQRVWHLVRFGRFHNREAAAQAMQAFKDQEQMDASVAFSNPI